MKLKHARNQNRHLPFSEADVTSLLTDEATYHQESSAASCNHRPNDTHRQWSHTTFDSLLQSYRRVLPQRYFFVKIFFTLTNLGSFHYVILKFFFKIHSRQEHLEGRIIFCYQPLPSRMDTKIKYNGIEHVRITMPDRQILQPKRQTDRRASNHAAEVQQENILL